MVFRVAQAFLKALQEDNKTSTLSKIQILVSYILLGPKGYYLPLKVFEWKKKLTFPLVIPEDSVSLGLFLQFL